MVVPNVLMWAASAIAAVWKISQLVRAPQDKGLRVVAVCTVLVFIALSAQLAVSVPVMSRLSREHSPNLIQNVFLAFFFALLFFLPQSPAPPEAGGSRGRIEVALPLLPRGALVATFAPTSPAVRGVSYEDANGH